MICLLSSNVSSLALSDLSSSICANTCSRSSLYASLSRYSSESEVLGARLCVVSSAVSVRRKREAKACLRAKTEAAKSSVGKAGCGTSGKGIGRPNSFNLTSSRGRFDGPHTSFDSTTSIFVSLLSVSTLVGVELATAEAPAGCGDPFAASLLLFTETLRLSRLAMRRRFRDLTSLRTGSSFKSSALSRSW